MKTNSTKHVVALFALSLTLAPFARSENAPETGPAYAPWETGLSLNAPYNPPCSNKIPVMAIWSKPEDRDSSGYKIPYTLTEERMSKFKECGFNIIIYDDPVDSLPKFLQRLQHVPDLNFLYSCGKLKGNNALSTLNEINSQTSLVEGMAGRFKGWSFKDEPMFQELKDLKTRYETLLAADPTKLIHINLVGKADSLHTGDDKDSGLGRPFTYKEYVDYYQNMYKPGYFSYDFYPVKYYGTGLHNDSVLFYQALQIHSHNSKVTRRPFWAYCQSAESLNKESNHHYLQLPEESYLRYEAFSALAMGAQGIVYWAYAPRKTGSENNEDHPHALIDFDGNPEDCWYYAKHVNNEISHLSYIFYGTELQSYYFAGTDYPGKTSEYMGPCKEDPLTVSCLKGKGSGVLVTRLKTGDKNYMMIVNQDPRNEVTVNISFNKKGYTITEIMICQDFKPSVGLSKSAPVIMQLETRKLGAGQYKIYSYESKN